MNVNIQLKWVLVGKMDGWGLERAATAKAAAPETAGEQVLEWSQSITL